MSSETQSPLAAEHSEKEEPVAVAAVTPFPAQSAYETSLSADPITLTPPEVKLPYSSKDALADIPAIHHAMKLFLASHMHESEELCEKTDPLKDRLYMTTGYGIIQCVKGMMSFEDEDILAALNHVKQGNTVASGHRKKAPSFTSRLTGYAWGGSTTGFIRSMTDVERHAELVYAESLFEKALLGIMYSGDWLAFVKEALNMRTTINIYHQLLDFINEMDAEASARYDEWVKANPSAALAPTPVNSEPLPVMSEAEAVPSSPAPAPTAAVSVPAPAPTILTPETPVVIDTLTTPKQHQGKFPKLFKSPKSPAFANFLGVGKHHSAAAPKPTASIASIVEAPTAPAEVVLSDTTSIDDVDDVPPAPVPAPAPALVTETPAVKPPEPFDESLDAHFRSGVYLGVGMSSLILSLMPGKLASIAEIFGYKGDRRVALSLLARAGGWENDEDHTWKGEKGWKPTSEGGEPGVAPGDEGIRRTICDMALAIFHVVLSSFTFDAVDIGMAERVLGWNLRRYPNGVFFLFGAGRLSITRSQPKQAIAHYTKAMEVQAQYRNLHHISIWEIAIATLSLWDVTASIECWKTLQEEATWSKAMYTYGHAVCLIELGSPEQLKEASSLMDQVPELRRRIAGKSIPLEKFVARKARKFQTQGGRLALPFLELAYVFLAISHAPRSIVTSKMLPEVEATLTKLKASEATPATYENGKGGFWDDSCLAQFLKGVCWRFIAYPDPDAAINPEDTIDADQIKAAAEQAVACFEYVFANGPKIELEHHLVYHAHYELGRLMACQKDFVGARKQLNLVISGKPLEINAAGRKGKYSLENALMMRTHAAVEAMDQKGQ